VNECKPLTVGKYDGKHPCLTAATSGGKIFIHNPYQQEADGSNIKYLNINKKISAVSHGELDPGSARDVLLAGAYTRSNFSSTSALFVG